MHKLGDAFGDMCPIIKKIETNCMGLLSIMTRRIKRLSASMLHDGTCAVVEFEGQKYFVTVRPYKEKKV